MDDALAMTAVQRTSLENALRLVQLTPPARPTQERMGTLQEAQEAVIAAAGRVKDASLAEAVERGWLVLAFDATHDSQRGAEHTTCAGIDVYSGKVLWCEVLTTENCGLKSELREARGMQMMLDHFAKIKGVLCRSTRRRSASASSA